MPAPRIPSHADVLRLWAVRSHLVADLMAQGLDVPYQTVNGWERNDSIPRKYWDAVCAAAQRRGWHSVTAESLDAAKQRRLASRPPRKNARRPHGQAKHQRARQHHHAG